MDFLDYIQAQRENENFAVLEKEKNWTYREFSGDTLFVYKYLIENKIEKLMVCLPQGYFAYVILWGAYLGGVTFCPVTNSVPPERKRYYASLFKPDLIVGDNEETFLNIAFKSISDLFSAKISTNKLYPQKVSNNRLAYVIFTSGSTGLPKGVMIRRSGLENFLSWSTKEYDVEPDDRWGQFSNLGFDLSICDIFTAILKGAALVPIPGKADKLLPGKLIANKKITFWHSVPSVIDLLNKAGHLNKKFISNLRIMTFCGEKLFPSQVELLFEANPDLTIYNTYGPTESTIFCTFLKLTKENYDQYCHNTISIGKAIPGCEIILSNDEENEDEIIITGNCLAKGYLGDENISNSKNTSFRTIKKEGKSQDVYFTGDYGETINTNLYFVCRKDSQIKVMGHRVDLSEIDFHLRQFGCKANITVFHQNKIISFIIYEPYSEINLKNYLSEKLPEYYLPNLIIRKQSFPYNSNGKIDLKKLLNEISI